MEAESSTTGTIAVNVTPEERASLQVSHIGHPTGVQLTFHQIEVSPGVFETWPAEPPEDDH